MADPRRQQQPFLHPSLAQIFLSSITPKFGQIGVARIQSQITITGQATSSVTGVKPLGQHLPSGIHHSTHLHHALFDPAAMDARAQRLRQHLRSPMAAHHPDDPIPATTARRQQACRSG
ncbi:hypothetical protein ACLOJK_022196 [Asimina triloba]